MKRKTQYQHVTQPHLKIIKTLWRDKPIRTSFVVIDLNGQEYPQNFLCIFPKNWFKKNQKSNLCRSKFFNIFGEQPHEIARTLLEDALRRETDSGVRAEIQTRLREVRESE